MSQGTDRARAQQVLGLEQLDNHRLHYTGLKMQEGHRTAQQVLLSPDGLCTYVHAGALVNFLRAFPLQFQVLVVLQQPYAGLNTLGTSHAACIV